ncbi:eukaryotic translation initiation factor eIF2A-domain-containing protein [Hyaloraphidium curvatum]|nr:eukaryotic translation initiation factor eIF2A-domain-containing protein [Hyaloraphidium curvatum]
MAHVLSVMHFKDVEKFAHMSDEYKEPAEEPFVAKEHLKSWLMDPRARDQFAVMRGEETAIFWNSKPEEELVYTRTNWTESYVQFSPYGTYLATFHRQGIALWGGPSWERLARFAHPGVKLIDFSPKETYLVSFSPDPITTPEGDNHNLLVWDVATGRFMRSFLIEPPGAGRPPREDRPAPQFEWPVFKWTPDDVYLTRMTPEGLSVYQTPDMGLLDKKSIKVEEIQGFAVSPGSDVVAYWTPEIGNNPARVTLMKLPSKEILRTKNLFNVKECRIIFHPSGSHVAVHVTRFTKTKKSTFSNIEIFRLKERDVPIDVLEVKQTEEVQLFAWEPEGTRFAFLAVEGAGAAAKNTIYIYEAPVGPGVAAPVPGTKESATPATVKLLKALDRKNIAGVHWSPKGRFAIFRSAQGELEWFDADDMATLSTVEHFGVNQLDWDPSGRYVVSTASGWKGGSDTGYNIYNIVGQNLVRRPLPGFRQFVWRPRPPLMLPSDKRKEIRKNIKDYSKEFEEIDAAATTAVGREVRERRIKLMEEWQQYRDQCRRTWEEQRPERERIPGWRPELDLKLEGQHGDDVEVEEIEEVVVEETEEAVDRIPGEDDDDEMMDRPGSALRGGTPSY